MCCNLVAQGNWSQLDKYLVGFLKSHGQSVETHPVLVLPVRREIALSTLHDTSFEAAVQYFNSSIRPLLQDAGLFVPLSGYVRRAVDSIKDKLDAKDWRSDLEDKEDFVECILDYIRLYFPQFIRHSQVTRVKKLEAIWNLTLILRNETGIPLKSNNKIHYCCLACGWVGGSTSGIKAQKVHLVGDKGHKPSCSMTTPWIYQLLEMQLPEPCAQQMKTPRIGQKRKRQSGTHQYDIQGPGQSSSANSDLLVLDAVASLPEEVREPELGQELNLHGRHEQEVNIEDFDDINYDIDFSLLDQLLEPPKGFMDVVAVLNSRRSSSMLVDELARVIPRLEFVQPARESLQSILECCNGYITLGCSRVVSAEAVIQSLVKMRGALSSVEGQELVAGQALNLFININREVDVLEKQCLQEMNPPLPASHGQPHGVAAPSLSLSGAAHSQYNRLLAQPLAPVVQDQGQVLRAREHVEPYNQDPALPQPLATHQIGRSEDQGAQLSPVVP